MVTLCGALAVTAEMRGDVPSALLLSTPQLRCGDSDLGRCVRDSLFNEVVRLDRAADAAWVACDTPEKLAARQREVRELAHTKRRLRPSQTEIK